MSSTIEAMQAIRKGDIQALQALLRASPELARGRDETGVSLLMQALYHRQEEIVELFLAHRGEDVDPFEAAALGRAGRLASLLDQHPERLGTLSPDGFTLLHLAAFFGREEAARLLLARGAPAEAAADNAMAVRPLHSAVAGGSAAVVHHLLAAGADPNTLQQRGFTPLMGAAAGGNREMVEDLLAHGADPTAVSEDGRTAADLARERGHGELVAVLEGGAGPS